MIERSSSRFVLSSFFKLFTTKRAKRSTKRFWNALAATLLFRVNNQPVQESESRPRSHLFTVRIWLGGLGEGRYEWRGKAQDVSSGETKYFRDWSMLLMFLQDMLSKDKSKGADPQGGRNAHIRPVDTT